MDDTKRILVGKKMVSRLLKTLPFIVVLFQISTVKTVALAADKTKTKASLKTSLQNEINADPTSIAPRVKLAKIQLDIKSFDDCVETLKPVYTDLDLDGLGVLERCYQGSKKFLNQIRVLEYMSSLEARNLQTKLRLSRAYYDTGKADKAITLLRELMSTNPNYQPAYEALFAIFQEEGNNYESRNVIEDMVTRFGKKPIFTTHLCRLYAVDEFHKAAIEWCKLAVGLDRKNADNHVYLGFAYKGIQNEEQGNKILLAAGKRFKRSELAQWAAGTIALGIHKYPLAFSFFSECLKVDPKSSRCVGGFGKSAIEVGKYQQALDTFTKTCKEDPTILSVFKEATRDLHQKAGTIWHRKFLDAQLLCRH